MEERQIKSRQRVAERGEVFTAEREVNAMLDLVKQETERIDSRFLEPACGTGNFLAEILRRKLDVVSRLYQRQVAGVQLQSVIAVSNIYGIDIMIGAQHSVGGCSDAAPSSECRCFGSRETQCRTHYVQRMVVHQRYGNAQGLSSCSSDAGTDAECARPFQRPWRRSPPASQTSEGIQTCSLYENSYLL